MAEEVKESKEPEKKKKGKLPVIIALVVVLVGGGFFGMKMKTPKAKPEIKAGEVVKLGEFLVNLDSGPNTYLRTEISVQLREGFSAEAFEKSSDAIKDAVGTILGSKQLDQVGSNARPALKKEIVGAINQILDGAMTPEQQKAEKGMAPGEGKKGDEHADWVDPTGPAINLYFTAFTTQ